MHNEAAQFAETFRDCSTAVELVFDDGTTVDCRVYSVKIDEPREPREGESVTGGLTVELDVDDSVTGLVDYDVNPADWVVLQNASGPDSWLNPLFGYQRPVRNVSVDAMQFVDVIGVSDVTEKELECPACGQDLYENGHLTIDEYRYSEWVRPGEPVVSTQRVYVHWCGACGEESFGSDTDYDEYLEWCDWMEQHGGYRFNHDGPGINGGDS